MEMGTIGTKVSRSHSEIRAFLSLTFCSPNPTNIMLVHKYKHTHLKRNNLKITAIGKHHVFFL